MPDALDPSRRRLKPRRLFLLGALLVVAILGVWLFVLQHRDGLSSETSTHSSTTSRESPAQLRSQARPIDVQTVKPTRRDVAYSIALPANVSPLYQTTLYAKVSGYLKWIGPDKGDQVKKGQIVAIIDAPEVEEQYQQSAADFKIKRITFERLSKVWKESPDVIAKQDVDVAEAAYEGAKNLMQQRAALRDYTKVR